MLDSVSFDSVSEQHLATLVSAQVAENRTLEYKEAIPADTHDGRREFLADVTSLANASGGHMLFGVKAQAGVPVALPGLSLADADKEILRLENTMRDGIEPRLLGVSIRPIALSSGASVLVLRIPRSWSGPHVVNYRGHWRFYSRNSAGKYPLDVFELRQQFLQASTIREAIREFRDQRLGRIIADELPVNLIPGARTVLHIVPMAPTHIPAGISFEPVSSNPWRLKPIYNTVTAHRYNLDGFLTSGGNGESRARGYVQFFRNGAIEALDVGMLRDRGSEAPFIPSVIFERELIEACSAYFKIQEESGVPLPLCLMLSLWGVKGYIMAVNRSLDVWGEYRYPIERDLLTIPEVILETYPSDARIVMRTVFDAVWNACGWPRSLGYGDDGVWGKGPNMRA